MYQFNYRASRIAWGPLNKQMAAFRSFPGGLPPPARPFTSLIESVFCSERTGLLVFPIYTVPLWGGGGNSAMRFCYGGAVWRNPSYNSKIKTPLPVRAVSLSCRPSHL